MRYLQMSRCLDDAVVNSGVELTTVTVVVNVTNRRRFWSIGVYTVDVIVKITNIKKKKKEKSHYPYNLCGFTLNSPVIKRKKILYYTNIV